MEKFHRIRVTFIIVIMLSCFSCDYDIIAENPIITDSGGGDMDSDGIPDSEDTDIDGDGLSNSDESMLFGTNPRIADTDGDGWNDRTEAYIYDAQADPYRFSPLIADRPHIQLVIEGSPDIGFFYQNSEEETVSRSITEALEYSSSRTISNQSAMATSIEHGWTVNSSVGMEISVGDLDIGTTFNWNVEVGVSGSYTQESSYQWGSEDSRTNTRAFESSEAYEIANGIVYSGGYLDIPIRIVNNGDIAYTVNSLSIAAYLLNPYDCDSIEKVENLTYDSNRSGFPLTINPGDSIGPFNCSNDNLSIDQVKEMLTKASSLITAISGYSIGMTGDDGISHDFTGTSTAASALCSEISIDYGPMAGSSRAAEKYMVAARTKFNEDYTSLDNLYFPTTLEEALDILHINFTEDGTGVYSGLSSLNQVSNNPETRSFWFVAIQEPGSEEVSLYSIRLASFDLDSLEIHAGQKISFIYSVDNDNDGLPLRIEEMIGSSDTAFDSDGDNIRDYDEVKGWELNGVKYKTNPGLDDTDCDGLTDDVDPIPTSRELYSTAAISSISLSDPSGGSDWTYTGGIVSGETIITGPRSMAETGMIISTVDPVYTVKIDGILLTGDATGKIWTYNQNGGRLLLNVSKSETETRNEHILSVGSEDGTVESTFGLNIYAPLQDPGFAVNNGQYEVNTFTTNSMGNITCAVLPISIEWQALTDDRVDGALIFWSGQVDGNDERPLDADPGIGTVELYAGFSTDLPDSSFNTVDNVEFCQSVSRGSNPTSFKARYYNRVYHFKMFTYAEEGDQKYYSGGSLASIDPWDPETVTVRVTPTALKLEDAWDELIGGSFDDIQLCLDIDFCYKDAADGGNSKVIENIEGDSDGAVYDTAYLFNSSTQLKTGNYDFPGTAGMANAVPVNFAQLFSLDVDAMEIDDAGHSSYSPGEFIINYLFAYVDGDTDTANNNLIAGGGDYLGYSGTRTWMITGYQDWYQSATYYGSCDHNHLTITFEMEYASLSR